MYLFNSAIPPNVVIACFAACRCEIDDSYMEDSINQWHTQNFRMGGVEVPQAPRGVGRSIPSHLGKGLWSPLGPSP